MTLESIADRLSDEFQSTFQVVDANTLMNLLLEAELAEVASIIRKHIPGSTVAFYQGVQIGPKRVYIVKLMDEKEVDRIMEERKNSRYH